MMKTQCVKITARIEQQDPTTVSAPLNGVWTEISALCDTLGWKISGICVKADGTESLLSRLEPKLLHNIRN
jgi:hypothetical protein